MEVLDKLTGVPFNPVEPTDPEFTVTDEFKDLAKESREKQRSTPDKTISQKFTDILSSTNMQDIQNKGVSRIGNVVLTPNIIKKANTDVKLRTKLYTDFLNTQKATNVFQDPEMPLVSFSTADYENIDESIFEGFDKTTPAFQELIASIKDRQKVAKVFGKNSMIPLKGRQLIIDEFETGNMYNELSNMIKSIPGDFLRLPNLAYMGFAAANSAYYGATSTEAGAFGNKFSQMMADTPGLRTWNSMLNNVSFLKDINTRFNEWYKSRYIAKHGENDYNENHRQVAFKTIIDQNGEQKIVMDTKDGQPVYRDKELDPKVVNDLLDLSYNELTATEKAGNFFLSITPFTLGARLARTGGDARLLKKLEDFRENNPEYKGLSDAQTLDKIRANRGYIDSAFRKAWQSFTFTSDKTRVIEGNNVADHVNVINNYDLAIGDLNTLIAKKKNELNVLEESFRGRYVFKKGEKTRMSKQIEELKGEISKNENLLVLNKQNKRTYVSKNGNGRYLNPYTISTVADDMIISSAMGYGPEVLGWMIDKTNDVFGTEISSPDTRTTELILGLTSPLAAPRIAQYTVKGTVGLVNIATGGFVDDTKRLLESSSFIPLINPGILVNNDEAKFTKIITEYNIRMGRDRKAAAPTQDELTNFRLMSKIFRNLRPEYREASFQSLMRYDKVMGGFEKQMRDLKMPEDVIARNMETLNLSMAEVTGLAPLIAYSNKVGMDYTATDAIDNIDQLTAISLAHEQKLNGIDTLLSTVKESIRQKTGTDLDSNSDLQKMFNYMSTMTRRQRDILTNRKAALQEQIDTFINSLGTKDFDEDTITKIVDLDSLLSGRVLSLKEHANKVSEVYNGLMTAANKSLDEIALFSHQATEKGLQIQIRRVADIMFDAEIGRRRALASKYYDKVDDYATQNNIKIDMTSLFMKLVDTTEEFKGKPLQVIFGRGSQFFSGLGSPLQKTFEKMATSGLLKSYKNRTEIDGLKDTYEALGKIPEGASDLELALFLRQEQIDKVKAGRLDKSKAKMIDFFDATASEAEDVMRYFKDRASRINAQSAKPTKVPEEIANEFISLIDNVLLEADPSGKLLQLQKDARKNYSVVVGEVTDQGSYVADVLNNRMGKRGKRENILKREGKHKYKNINRNMPETPFKNISNLAEEFVFAKTTTEQTEILAKIQTEKDRVFSFLGASKSKDMNGVEQYAFDLRQPRQVKILQMAETLMNVMVTKQLSASLKDTAEKVAEKVAKSYGKEMVNLDSITPENYNFKNAINILELEKKLMIPVINKNGMSIEMPLFSADKIPGYTVDITGHMKTSEKARKTFTDMTDEMNNKKSALNIEAKGLLDDEAEALDVLRNITNYVKNPKRFYQENFENATAESINQLVEDLFAKSRGFDITGKAVKKGGKGKPVTRAMIRNSLKFMYLRGVFELAGVKTAVGGNAKLISEMRKKGTDDPAGLNARSEVGDVVSFTNMILDKKNREVTEAVLGTNSDHMKFLTDMAEWINFAGGNPRGFAPRGDTKGLTIDSVFSRVFNIARGMVSPLYVGTEVATRILLEKNQSLLTVALRDRDAARILAMIVKNPENVRDRDINTLAQRIKIYATMAAIQSKGGIPTLNEFMGLDEQEVLMEAGELSDPYVLTEGVN